MLSCESHLTFRASGRTFAVAASRVLEVMRYEAGGDLPLLDLGQRFSGIPTPIGSRTCVVVVGGRASCPPFGLIVDEATDFVTFAEDQMLAPPDFGPRIALPYLASLARADEGETLSIVLDVDSIEDDPCVRSGVATVALGAGPDGRGGRHSAGSELLVAAGAHRLALAVEDVQEIIERGVVTLLPGLPAAMAGVVAIRGRAVPLIDVAAAVHGDAPRYDRRSVIIAGDGVRPLALLVDAVEQIAEEVDPGVLAVDPRDLLEALG